MEIAGFDVKSTFHPINGYQPKETEQAFQVYERTRSRITALSASEQGKDRDADGGHELRQV
jgi:hypothetical protein